MLTVRVAWPGRDVTVCILDRPRHAELIRECRQAGARIRLLSDGDVAGAAGNPFLVPLHPFSAADPLDCCVHADTRGMQASRQRCCQ